MNITKLVLFLCLFVSTATTADDAMTVGWPVTEGSSGGGRYSPLSDIHVGNVSKLKEVWRYRHGDFFDGEFPTNRGTSFITTPVIVANHVVFTTPTNRVIALDPETGAERWAFDPGLDVDETYANMWANRGVAVWQGQKGDRCSPRVFLATMDARLIALDVYSGKPCADFAIVDLRKNIQPLLDDAEYGVTSPGTVVDDVVVVGSSIPDQLRPNSPPGDVRGFDVRTGALLWTFHTIPHVGEYGRETWGKSTKTTGAANVWSTITADVARGIVFLPVSSASPDHYGGDRLGDNLYSDAVVALDAKTGKRLWHYQTTRHDLWDYDLAAPPLLVSVRRDGREIPAVVILAKTGFVFILNRTTGEPLFPIEEMPAPGSDVPGEQTAPTQPKPIKPPPLVAQQFTEDDIYSPNSEHRDACLKRLSALRNDGVYTPPSLGGSLIVPATGGGANWAGSAFDPERRLMFVPVAELGIEMTLEHVSDENVGKDGGARPQQGVTLRNIWWFLTGKGTGERYRLVNGHVLFAHNGTPCNKPPWGRLVAVDVDKGEIAWSVSTSSGADDLGNSTHQPPLATAGGLIFHGGSWWPRLRVHDANTGELIHTMELPAGAHGGTITYKLRPDGQQYLLVSAGGHDQLGSPKGDYVIAYALPK